MQKEVDKSTNISKKFNFFATFIFFKKVEYLFALVSFIVVYYCKK